MKTLHFLLFFISVHFFAQSKDNIMLEPHFEIGKVYRIEIFDNNDSFQTIHKKTFKHTTEQKTNVELKYLQKAGSDYLFSWKIIDKDYMNVDIDAKNIIMIDFPEKLEIIFKIDSAGQYAGINNYESIIYQLTKDIDEKFIKKIKKENPNVKLNWEQVIESYKENIKSSVKLYNSNIEFFFRFNNILFYKGKSYFSNVRERSKSSDFSLPMRKEINFSEDDTHYILKVNYNLENQYLQSQDYAFYFFNRFPNYETFKKEYKEESEGNYLFDKKTCLPTYIELKSELTYDVKGNKSCSTKIFKILN